MGTVALDADVLIGFLDPADAQHNQAVELLRPWLSAGNRRLVSASVYAEILVRPMRLGLSEVIDAFIADAGIDVIPIDRTVAQRAAELRAAHDTLRLPDAFALATAFEHEAIFLTLDARLRRIIERLE